MTTINLVKSKLSPVVSSQKSAKQFSFSQYSKSKTPALLIIVIFIIMFLNLTMEEYLMRRSVSDMLRDANAILLQTVFVDGGIEDLLDLTDTDDESSSSSNVGVFEANEPFVLELHDLVKDQPTGNPQQKIKKHKKKKGQPAKQKASDTSSSVSESSVPPAAMEEHSREEFYDAHESYHGLTENQLTSNPVATVGLLQARSEHGPTPKLPAELTVPQTPGHTPGSGSRREPSTISKPTTGPQ